ncbi:MAG: hypothetical protein M3R24_06015 [Chloroflexota bacterium]|nr:hypothetical protein [Chloroflexota bacterium]
MMSSKRTFDLRTALIIGGAALLGAAWAAFNLYRAGGNGALGATAALVWTIFATPFFTFWGWLLAKRAEGWLAAFVCFCIYFFAVFIGARLELLIQGQPVAAANEHALYFRLTLIIQLIAGVVVAAQRSYSRGTMQVPTEV